MDHTRLVAAVGMCFLGASLLPLSSPASPSNDPFTPEQRKFWAFQKVKRAPIPSTIDSSWVENPIDAFILAGLEAKGLKPAPPAAKVTLIRRASFNLIGLPPTLEEVKAFLEDESPDAFKKVVDRLLASPHYGERWARHWLDLARYADSHGFRGDQTRPNAWRYRDYVTKSLNEDKPYNRFVREQIAGDELWPHDSEARIGTGFNRHYPDETNAADLMQRRQEILYDITDTVGSVFMGLTVGCAKCHDHKFDPILQKDYYRLQAFFAGTGEDSKIPIWSQDRIRKYKHKLAGWEQKTKRIREEIAALGEPERQAALQFTMQKYPALVTGAIKKPLAERTPYEALMVQKASSQIHKDPLSFGRKLKGEAKERYEELKARLKEYEPLHPGEFPVGEGIADIGWEAPATYVLGLGGYNSKQEEVKPSFLTILDPQPPNIKSRREPLGGSSGRRTALANWLIDPKNPLTQRVIVNRVWHYHFGRGIVGTPSDFGAMGERPTHPKLLDWLAHEFVRSGWSIKHLHRLIMTSNTFQQSWGYRPSARKVDPFNRLLWRFPPQRLEAEVIRDSALHVSGLLNGKIGGESVFPPLPPRVPTPPGGWEVSEDLSDHHRRSIYVFVRRNATLPMLRVFDLPDTHETCARRNVTTTAPQALALLNSEPAMERAQAFASRVLKAAGTDRKAQVERAYLLAYSRRPDERDKNIALTFFTQQSEIIAERLAAGEPLVTPSSVPQGMAHSKAAALVDFCHALLNSNEFVYRR